MHLFFVLLFGNFIQAYSLNVVVVESQSYAGHVMDTVWNSLLTSLGHTVTISPQTILDNNSFFATTDVLIVASGIITLPANRVATIQDFLLSGKSVYLQSEYQMAYSTSQAYQYIVNNNGGSFSWIQELSGDLFPTIAYSTFATTPNVVNPLNYFWYGIKGCAGVDESPILAHLGQDLGFMFMPAASGIGNIATTSDQDWIRTADIDDLNLMHNIFEMLIDTAATNSQVVSTLALGNDTTYCNGDTITLQAGTYYNTYLWSNGSTDASIVVTTPGTYWVSVSNNSCGSLTDSVVLSFTNCGGLPPIAALSSSDTTWCDKNCINFSDMSQFVPTQWQWYFAGASPTTSTDQHPQNICYNNYGSFDVALVACNANGCDSIFLPAFITEFQLPQQPVLTTNFDTLFSSTAFSYQWYNVNNATQVLGTNQWFVPAVAGNYFVLISDSNGCQVPSATIGITIGIDDVPDYKNSGIRYNADEQMLYVGQQHFASTLRIYSIDGRLVHESKANAGKVDVSFIKPGVYTVVINGAYKIRFAVTAN
ncbi:MAG: hypothetical protein IPO27_04155 [Bacteroidetes bacterium]|nr:hypothetical protein [Bacteroidota bacterium]